MSVTLALKGDTHVPSRADAVPEWVRLLTPGCATGARPATETTTLTAGVDGDDVDVTVRRE